MASKSEQLQIRVTPRHQAALKRLAPAAGHDVSSSVLTRTLLPAGRRFEELVALLADGAEHRYVLAELNDFLSALAPGELSNAITWTDLTRLSPFLRNYVAAMIEHTCYLRGVPPPVWTARVAPLDTPFFAAPLKSLRLHLLRASPVAFKQRNLFVDATVGARI